MSNEWMLRGACRGEPLDLFFPLGSTGPENVAQVEEATAVCRRCPVTAECLEFSLRRPERHGVWGGLTWEQREKLRRKALRKAAA